MAVNITYFVHGTTIDNLKNISSGWYDVQKTGEKLIPGNLGGNMF